jgi:hypothetical protein
MRVYNLYKNLKILLWWNSRALFQQIVNNDVPLPGLLDWSTLLASLMALDEPEQTVVRRD